MEFKFYATVYQAIVVISFSILPRIYHAIIYEDTAENSVT